MSVYPIARVCLKCNKTFDQIHGSFPQRICDPCKEANSDKAGTTQREVIKIVNAAQLVSLPGQWQKFHSGNPRHLPSYKVDFLGRDLGGYGRGRIVVRSLEEWEANDLVQVRVMQSSKNTSDGAIKYNYIVLDKVDPSCEIPENLPKLQWRVIVAPAGDDGSADVEVEDFSIMSMMVEARREKQGVVAMGILAVTTEKDAIIVTSRGKELLLMD